MNYRRKGLEKTSGLRSNTDYMDTDYAVFTVVARYFLSYETAFLCQAEKSNRIRIMMQIYFRCNRTVVAAICFSFSFGCLLAGTL